MLLKPKSLIKLRKKQAAGWKIPEERAGNERKTEAGPEARSEAGDGEVQEWVSEQVVGI